ncbi:uncharacterized protein V1513DRAFT_454922 [Lipomyces chichibuensis]|uniref:uncharacterized protein n=1 Tax=Lipomyces chichibuensis TaxID=1546026 RepID=UPI0033437B9E
MACVNSKCQGLRRLFLVITAITITLCTKANAGYLPVECTPAILWLADPLLRDNVNGTLTRLEAVAIEMFQNANYYALTMQISRLYGGFSRG